MGLRHLGLLFTFFFLFSQSAFAGRVLKVKGKKVYIKFSKKDHGTFGKNDLFYLLNRKGKKRAIIHLKKVRGFKAIAILRKGKARKGYSTLFKGLSKKAKKKKRMQEDEDYDDAMASQPEGSSWGLMGGYGMASQEVDQGNGNTSSQSGSSLSVKGVYDYPFLSTIDFRIMGGIEKFSVSGDGVVTGTNNAATVGSDIMYITLDILAKWNFYSSSSMNFYGLGGVGILFPLSKESTAIVPESIDQLVIGEFGGGVEFKMGSFKIPVELSYYYFPSGEDVSTNVISFKSGLIWPF